MSDRDNFRSYYWHDEASKPALKEVESRLRAGESNPHLLKENLLALLESSNPAVVGIAFDRLVREIAAQRFGGEKLDKEIETRLIDRAREQLAGSPISGLTVDGVPVEGANYASALGVLSHFGDATDVPRIEQIVLHSHDVNVWFEACLALARCLPGVKAEYPALVEALGSLVETAPGSDLRLMAIQALGEYQHPIVEGMLIKLAQNAPLPWSAHAAWILAERDLEKHRAFLTEIVSRWPVPAPYPAQEVLKELTGDAE